MMIDITARGAGDKKTAVALGFFDGLHLGHIEVIKQALIQSDLSSVVFTFNERTVLPKFKTRENIVTYDLKMELFSKMGADYVFAPDFAEIRGLSAKEFVDEILVKKLNARFVACGYDFRFAKDGASDAAELELYCSQRGIKTVVVPAVRINGEIVSSTAIRQYIKDGNVEAANEMLGYELTYVLPVVHGNKIGKTLGFPTANQFIPEGTIVPKNGVYKSWVQISGKNYPAITNIGIKPTISLQKGETVREPIMETHVIGFTGDLYGLRMRVTLRSYIRPEKKFGGLDELRRQLEADKLLVLGK